jgi:hypothetical protein
MTDELENELKPCPFCGGQVHRIDGDDENAHDIECDGCAYIFYDLSEGNNWWNDRPIEDALRNGNDQWQENFTEAETLLKKCEDWLMLFSYNPNNTQDHLNTSNYLLWDIHNFLNECD